MKIYKIENLSFSYDEKCLIFENIDLQIDINKITLLAGINGSGKTTFCRLLSGLEKKYQGKIFLENNALTKLSSAEISDKIVYLKQESFANIIAATPIEDIAIWKHKFQNKILPEFEKEQLQALKEYNLEQFKDQPFWEMSGGQIKRVGLAGLLLNIDKYWILDEPVTGLENALIDILINILQKRKTTGKGALIISHRFEKFEQIVDNWLKIEDKKIIDTK